MPSARIELTPWPMRASASSEAKAAGALVTFIPDGGRCRVRLAPDEGLGIEDLRVVAAVSELLARELGSTWHCAAPGFVRAADEPDGAWSAVFRAKDLRELKAWRAFEKKNGNGTRSRLAWGSEAFRAGHAKLARLANEGAAAAAAERLRDVDEVLVDADDLERVAVRELDEAVAEVARIAGTLEEAPPEVSEHARQAIVALTAGKEAFDPYVVVHAEEWEELQTAKQRWRNASNAFLAVVSAKNRDPKPAAKA